MQIINYLKNMKWNKFWILAVVVVWFSVMPAMEIFKYFRFRQIDRGVLFSAQKDACLVLAKKWKIRADLLLNGRRHIEAVKVSNPWNPWGDPIRLLEISFDRPALGPTKEGALEHLQKPWGMVSVISAKQMIKEGYSQAAIDAASHRATAIDGRISFVFSSTEDLDAIVNLGSSKDSCSKFSTRG